MKISALKHEFEQNALKLKSLRKQEVLSSAESCACHLFSTSVAARFGLNF